MIDEVIVEFNNLPIYNNVLVHYLHVAAAMSPSKQPQYSRRIHPSLYPTIAQPTNNMPTL